MSKRCGGGEEKGGRGGRTEFRIKFTELDRGTLFCSLVSSLAPANARAHLSLSPLSPASALVPSPRPLAGACFFPTRSSGIPPLLTAVSASPARGWTRIRSWETFIFGPLSSPPLTLRYQVSISELLIKLHIFLERDYRYSQYSYLL